MGKKYLYMQGGSDKFKSLPPIYGKIPLRYRDRHHIINGKAYVCSGPDLVSNIDPLMDNTLVAKFRLDGNFTNIAPGSNGITLQAVDSTRVYFEKSGPFASKALNFYPMDVVSTNNNLAITNYIDDTVFSNGVGVSVLIKINDFFNLASMLDSTTVATANSNKLAELFRFTTDISSDNTSAENTIRNPALFIDVTNGSLLSNRSVKYNILNNQTAPLYLVNKGFSIANYSDKWLHLAYTTDDVSEKLFIDGEMIYEMVSDKGELKDILGYFTLGSGKLSNNISYKQLELYNKKLTDRDVRVLFNQRQESFIVDEGVVYYEENNKLMYLNTDNDGNILSKGFEDKLGYNGNDKNLLSVNANGEIIDSYGNNPFAGKINRVLQNTSNTLSTVINTGWGVFNSYDLDMDTDKYDYVIALTNNVRVYGVPQNGLDRGALINISINGSSLVTNAPVGYNNASNLVTAANNNSYSNVTTLTPKITSGYVGKFKLNGSIAKYGTSGQVTDTTWGVSNSVNSNDANVAQNRQFANDKSDFIIYEIHKDNNRRF